MQSQAQRETGLSMCWSVHVHSVCLLYVLDCVTVCLSFLVCEREWVC